MRVTSNFIRRLHLDSQYGLLTGRNAQLVFEYFQLLDCRGNGELDDVQFLTFLQHSTDLSERQIYKVFDIFDLDRSGSCEFDEDNQAKHFMYQHWRTCFELLDEDGSKTISRAEFETLGFLFNFSRTAVRKIFDEFDVSGDSELDQTEFRLFAFAAIDLQQELERLQREREEAKRTKLKQLQAKENPGWMDRLQKWWYSNSE